MERRNKNNKSAGKLIKKDMIYMDLREILREHALRYLPAKAIHRSLTVCRDWKLQISTPFFVHNQSVAFRSISGFFMQPPGCPPSFVSLDQMAYGVPDQELKFLPEPVDVRASCNGLLCCQGRSGDRVYYVCNPVNKQWKKLPKPTADHGPQPAPILVFEPSLMNFFADYKVICIFVSTDIEQAYEFEIYSSVQDSWKVSPEMYFFTSASHIEKGIYVNGVAYWPINGHKILAFDIKTEKATEVSGYGYYGAMTSSMGAMTSSMGAMNGKLCFSSLQGLSIKVTVLHNRHGNTMPMRSRNNSWQETIQLRFNSADVKPGACDQPQILLTWEDVILVKYGNKVFACDVKTHKTTTLQGEINFGAPCATFPYVNSLVSLM